MTTLGNECSSGFFDKLRLHTDNNVVLETIIHTNKFIVVGGTLYQNNNKTCFYQLVGFLRIKKLIFFAVNLLVNIIRMFTGFKEKIRSCKHIFSLHICSITCGTNSFFPVQYALHFFVCSYTYILSLHCDDLIVFFQPVLDRLKTGFSSFLSSYTYTYLHTWVPCLYYLRHINMCNV